MAIHLGVHSHLVADGKCKESLEETRRLIIKEVIYMPIAKTFAISLSVDKTFTMRKSCPLQLGYLVLLNIF
jgi:hypothetical protein